MEEASGVVKHVLLAKFKDDVSPERVEQLIKGFAALVTLIEPMKTFHCMNILEQLIKGFAALVTLIEPMKTFHWGKDVSIGNMHQGFTHVFESTTFESKEGIAEYVAHPVHVEFANELLPALEKVIVIDYKPTVVSS